MSSQVQCGGVTGRRRLPGAAGGEGKWGKERIAEPALAGTDKAGRPRRTFRYPPENSRTQRVHTGALSWGFCVCGPAPHPPPALCSRRLSSLPTTWKTPLLPPERCQRQQNATPNTRTRPRAPIARLGQDPDPPTASVPAGWHRA